MTRVKICGIRSLADAQLAVHAGADAVGVLVGQLHPSEDFISASEAAAIVASLPSFISGVLVSHLQDPAALLELATETGVRCLQLHGALEPGAIAWIRQHSHGLCLLRAIHPEQAVDLSEALTLEPWLDGWVADTANPATGQVGGTGLVHDWALSAELRRRLQRPLILAGGLDAANVGAAIARVQPYGVDVNSGVKGLDGRKCAAKLQAFVRAVRCQAMLPG